MVSAHTHKGSTHDELIAEARQLALDLRGYDPGEYDPYQEAGWEKSATLLDGMADAIESAVAHAAKLQTVIDQVLA